MKADFKTIDMTNLEILKDHFETVTFQSEFDLVYEKQIPNTGIILIHGELNLLKKKKILELRIPGISLGIKNILENDPFHFKCRVKKGTELILLPKSEIIRILKEKNSPLYPLCMQLGA